MTSRGTSAHYRAPERLAASPVASRANARATAVPLSADEYRLQVTIRAETYEKLRRVQDLVRYAIPEAHRRGSHWALTLLLANVERRRCAAAARPGAGDDSATARATFLPRSRRSLAARSGTLRVYERHAPVRRDGVLEFHHAAPFTDGGASTVGNIELRCRRRIRTSRRCGAVMPLSSTAAQRYRLEFETTGAEFSMRKDYLRSARWSCRWSYVTALSSGGPSPCNGRAPGCRGGCSCPDELGVAEQVVVVHVGRDPGHFDWPPDYRSRPRTSHRTRRRSTARARRSAAPATRRILLGSTPDAPPARRSSTLALRQPDTSWIVQWRCRRSRPASRRGRRCRR